MRVHNNYQGNRRKRETKEDGSLHWIGTACCAAKTIANSLDDEKRIKNAEKRLRLNWSLGQKGKERRVYFNLYHHYFVVYYQLWRNNYDYTLQSISTGEVLYSFLLLFGLLILYLFYCLLHIVFCCLFVVLVVCYYIVGINKSYHSNFSPNRRELTFRPTNSYSYILILVSSYVANGFYSAVKIKVDVCDVRWSSD